MGPTQLLIQMKPKRRWRRNYRKLKRSDKFMEDHWRDIRRYGMLHDYRDSEELLKEKPHLACEDTVDYLLAWCIGLEVEGKRALMERVTHQIVSMQSLLQIAAELELNPRSAAINFFQKMGKRANRWWILY